MMERSQEDKRLFVRGVHYHLVQTSSMREPAVPPLLLLHGFTGDVEVWQDFIAQWDQVAPFIAIDFLGHGQSDVPDDASRYEMSETVLDLVAILDALDIAQVDVLGYSMGGRVALAFASMCPTRVRRVVLESASPGLNTEAERQHRIASDTLLAEEILEKGVHPFAVKWGALPLFASQNQLPTEVLQRQFRIRTMHAPLGLANSLRGLGTGKQPSLWGKLASVTVPTLLITGQLDAKFCDIASQMQAALPAAKHVVVEHSGHTIHLEQPTAFSNCVKDFLGWGV